MGGARLTGNVMDLSHHLGASVVTKPYEECCSKNAILWLLYAERKCIQLNSIADLFREFDRDPASSCEGPIRRCAWRFDQ